MEKDNTTWVLSLLVEELRIPVTRQSIHEELQKHPDFPSLLSISDVLNNWNIPNASYQLAFEQLADVPIPFIAYFEDGFAVVNRLNKKQALVSNERGNNHHISIEDFKKSYRGTVLAVEKNDTSGEANYATKRRKEIANNLRIPFIIWGTLVVFFAFLLSNPSYTATDK